MAKKILLIVNPMAGKGQAKAALYDIVSTLCSNGSMVTVMMTQKSGDADRFAREKHADFDIVACVGGDGTLSEVVGGLMQVENPPPIGYIPMGSTNDVARTLMIPKVPRFASYNVINGKPLAIDIGKLGDKYFSYIAAFGAFTDVPYTTPQRTKNIIGPLAYFLEGAVRLPKIPTYHAVVTYDGGVIEGEFMYGGISNTTSVGGVMDFTSKNVALNDGLFEILLIRTPPKGFTASRLFTINEIVTDVLSQNYNSDSVLFLRTKKAKFEFDEPVPWTRDGENGGMHQTAEVTNIQGALKIMIRE